MKRAGAVAGLAAIVVTIGASAQPHRPSSRPPVQRSAPAPAPVASPSDDPFDLRARFGIDRVMHLLTGDAEERLRGVERAAALGTPEAVLRLAQQLENDSATRGDARAKMAIARGLAGHVDLPGARAALILLVGFTTPRSSPHAGEGEDPESAARLEMARRMSALALAQAGDARSIDALMSLARGPGVGAAAAAAALAAFPPSSATPWATPLNPAALRLIARIGDRRALEAVLAAAKGGETEARAAAIEALGALGDARVVPLARAGLADEDPRVRGASGEALVALGAPEAPHAVEGLVADEVTANLGIELAAQTHGPGVVRALSARAAVSADLEVRAAAVAALGRDPTGEGVEALLALEKDPLLRADALDALARSPSGAAMGALERLAAQAETRRLGVKAYVVRALARRETSAAIERVAGELAGSKDPADRAAGTFARVALGELEVGVALDDPQPLVRRAAALATFGRATAATRAALLGRRGREEDAATRVVLGAGLAEGDPEGQVATRALYACATAGGGDGPLCALAFARASSSEDDGRVRALVTSRDPVIRAHALRGLSRSQDPTRIGRLVSAYAYEADPAVRRAVLAGLAGAPRGLPSAADCLAGAARLDPDAGARWVAARVLAGRPLDEIAPADAEVAWMRLVEEGGAPPAPGATGMLVRPDGLALPIAFDADGDALVPGTPPGRSRLVLAPLLGAAYVPAP